MHIHRKILFGAAALVLPVSTIGLIAATSGVASASGTSCSVSGTVSFASPGLNTAGNENTSKTSATSIANGDLSCGVAGTGNIGGGNLTITTKSTKCKGADNPDPACTAKGEYEYGSWADFQNEGVTSIAKSLKKMDVTVGSTTYAGKISGTPTIITGNACTNGTYGSEAGFGINYTVKSPKPDKGDTISIVACLGAVTGPSLNDYHNFIDNAFGPGSVQTSTIDSTDSSVTIS